MNRGLKYCVNCEHWYCYKYNDKMNDSFDGVVLGECRRYPPSMPIIANSASHDEKPIKELIVALYRQVPETSYPYVYSNEWCGEFKLADKICDAEGFDAEWSDE